jgi:hypothetical protein
MISADNRPALVVEVVHPTAHLVACSWPVAPQQASSWMSSQRYGHAVALRQCRYSTPHAVWRSSQTAIETLRPPMIASPYRKYVQGPAANPAGFRG